MGKEKAIDKYRGIWVFAEARNGRIAGVVFELLGKGRELADLLDVKLTAVLLGEGMTEQAKELICYGADEVLYADTPMADTYRSEVYIDVIAREVINRKPEIFLIGATITGRDLAPGIARKFNTGLTADCTAFAIDQEKRLLVQTKPAFGRNIMVSIVCPVNRPQIATARPGVMNAIARDPARKGKIISIPADITEEEIKIKIIETTGKEEEINLEEARIIVSGGKGVGSAEGFNMLRELAALLDGQIAASGGAVECGWISHDYQIGQTGITVKPDLYIACGISGSIQHNAGMRESKFIIAINEDPEAEIFEIADLGIVGNLHEIVPALIAELKNLGTNNN